MKLDLGDFAFWAGIFLVIILFAGEPDLMSAIINSINQKESEQCTTNANN